MHEAHLITTPFATPEETAETLGLPRNRARALISRVRESLDKTSTPNARLRSRRVAKSRAKPRGSSRRKPTRAKPKRSR